jgi:tetratricopeptide (TPR) repeat protein
MRVIDEVRREIPNDSDLSRRVLKHLISYGVYQFGDRISGKPYRERGNSGRISNWKVEILILIPIYKKLIPIFNGDKSLSLVVRSNLRLSYLEKVLDLLRPWSVNFNINATSHLDNLNKDQIGCLLTLLSQSERSVGLIYMSRKQFEEAQDHCQSALSYTRLYVGTEENKADLLCSALKLNIQLQRVEGNYDEALAFAEEAYDVFAVAYNPVHPKVQEAAVLLIRCLINTNDLYNAERFAEATLDSLKDPANGMDQGSEVVAKGYYNLANVINYQKRDFVKAEMLVRESLRIRSQLYSHDDLYNGISVSLLASTLSSQGKLGDETKELYERFLAIIIKQEGPDARNTAVVNNKIGAYYYKLAGTQHSAETRIEHLHASLSKYQEALRIYTKIFGPDYPATLEASLKVSFISQKLSEG